MQSRTVKTCGPDASTPASSQRRRSRPDRVRSSLNPLATVTRKPDRRGEYAISRNPSRVGAPGESGVPVVSVPLHSLLLHTKLRVQRAPGVPHTLVSRPWDHAQLGRRPPRDRGGVACEYRCLKSEVAYQATRGACTTFRHSGSRAAAVRNPYSRSWLWIPGSRKSAPRNDEPGDAVALFTRRDVEASPYIFSCPAGAAVPCCWRSCSLAWWRP
jgi:hypothetical protein